jgi:hypothetical protein
MPIPMIMDMTGASVLATAISAGQVIDVPMSTSATAMA